MEEVAVAVVMMTVLLVDGVDGVLAKENRAVATGAPNAISHTRGNSRGHQTKHRHGTSTREIGEQPHPEILGGHGHETRGRSKHNTHAEHDDPKRRSDLIDVAKEQSCQRRNPCQHRH